MLLRNKTNLYFTNKFVILYIKLYFLMEKETVVKTILVTGGTTFVSKYVAEYFVEHAYEVYVLNRNTKPQVEGVSLIEGDRHELGDRLKKMHFDVVADITAYNARDIAGLCDALGSFQQYLMISSSAVYPEYGIQPFQEDSPKAENKFWGTYGTDKTEAENELLKRIPDAYILRPPYLYGPMNNVYREAFVFDCAKSDRKFYLPGDGEMNLQFLHVKDLCRFMEILIETKPQEHIFNVGNAESISIKEWVTMCYDCFHKNPEFVKVSKNIEQRNYFSFYDYEYALDVQKQQQLLPDTVPLADGLMECSNWYMDHENEVKKKPYLQYIEEHMQNGTWY